jgi:hypothetical protein
VGVINEGEEEGKAVFQALKDTMHYIFDVLKR